MANPPTDTVALLFTNMEGSTRLTHKYPGNWEALRLRHNIILQTAMKAYDRYVFQIISDAFCGDFHTACQAVQATEQAQIALTGEDRQAEPVKLQMGLHIGQAFIREGDDYHGLLGMHESGINNNRELLTKAHILVG
jgi:class 3 adenylate cyclase